MPTQRSSQPTSRNLMGPVSGTRTARDNNMAHPRVVTARDLEKLADAAHSHGSLQRLVKRLIKVSSRRILQCRLPDTENQPGLDGLVESEDGYGIFVAVGKSYWELSNRADVQRKATEDLKKRTDQLSDAARRADTTFVFATFRSWRETRPESWFQKHAGTGWKRLVILDSEQLSEWLSEFPAVAREWMSEVGLTVASTGWRTVGEHWDNLKELRESVESPSLPPELFLNNRNQASAFARDLFDGRADQLCIGAEDPRDICDFVAALVESQSPEIRERWSGLCLMVETEEGWSRLVQLPGRHILVAGASLDLDGVGEQLRLAAKRAGHGVVLPMALSRGGSMGAVWLVHPTRQQMQEVLVSSGYPEPRARALVEGVRSLSEMKRRLAGLPVAPPYADSPNARALALAGLFGRWDANRSHDMDAVIRILGKPYGEWLEAIRAEVLKPAAPLVHRNERWKVVSRVESWESLGPWLDDSDLRRFELVVFDILTEADPAIDMAVGERWMSSALGRHRQFSDSLRRGVAETLGLLGSRPARLTCCSAGRPEQVARTVVRQLLHGADWRRWIDLHDLMPLFAEAAPEEFLNAVDHALATPNDSPLRRLLAEEGGGIGGVNYLTGLLWALEILAWNPEHFARVMLILGALASIDPGGQWANRPSNSMTRILLPWFPQTVASVEVRVVSVRAVGRDYPDVAWSLLMSLLPESTGSTWPTCRPTWRTEWLAGWEEDQPTRQAYFEQLEAYAELAVEHAADHPVRLAELVEKLPVFALEARESILQRIVARVKDRPEELRLPIWDAAVDLVSSHRAFPSADWALSDAEITRLEKIAGSLAPSHPSLRHRRLFSDRDLELFQSGAAHEEQVRLLARRRDAALTELLTVTGLDGVTEFARNVTAPLQVGLALGRLGRPGDDAALLPSLLRCEDGWASLFVRGFVMSRWGLYRASWFNRLRLAHWTPADVTRLLVLLPFTQEVWELADNLLGDAGDAYWRSVRPDPWDLGADLMIAVERLLRCGRPRAALACCAVALRSRREISVLLAIRALHESVQASGERLDPWHAIEAIKWLQTVPDVPTAELASIEWCYLPILDGAVSASPKTLEAQIARDPAQFCELIQLAYRPAREDADAPPPSEEARQRGMAAYRLLDNMVVLPGMREDGTVDGPALMGWVNEVRRIATDSGHLRMALRQIGQLFGKAATDTEWPNRLKPVAEILDAGDAEDMRKGFVAQIYNNRGVFSPTGGREESEIARRLREQANLVERSSLVRLANALRELARTYEQESRDEADDGEARE